MCHKYGVKYISKQCNLDLSKSVICVVLSFFNIIRDVKEVLIMSWEERKLDHLKMNPRGTTNKVPTCAVPMHAPQANSFRSFVRSHSSVQWGITSVQFSFMFKSDWARTLKMPVPYPPPNVGAYTRTPSHQPLVFGRKGIDHLP